MSKRIFLILFLLFIFQKGFSNQPVYIFTVRKSGTNMVDKLFTLLRIPHQTEHLLYLSQLHKFLSEPDAKGIVLIRDPRSVCVSGVFWRTNLWSHTGPYGSPLDGKKMYLDPYQLKTWNAASFHEKLMITIGHEFPLPFSQINREYQLAEEVLDSKPCFLLRFEDIVGSAGGGSDEKQYQTIKEMLRFLHIDVSDVCVRRAQRHLFGSSATFRKGQIDDWKNYFHSDHISLFKQKMNHLLLDWGYENCADWDQDL